MSKASTLVLFFLATLTLATNGASAQPPTKPTFLDAICETELGNYTTAEYDTNLKTVLSTLLQEANSTSAFASASAGSAPDAVFGQYYCRGDVASDFCSKCVLQAAVAALTFCPLAKGAVVFHEECTLRYGNQALLGLLSTTPGGFLRSKSNVTDPSSFRAAATTTLTGLVTEVSNGSTRFATGEGTVSAEETVYCLVQCSPDLNGTQCHSCLEFAAQVLTTCCGEWPSYLYVFLPSCQMMYNTLGAFYFTPGAPPAVSTSSSPPPQPNSGSLGFVRIPH